MVMIVAFDFFLWLYRGLCLYGCSTRSIFYWKNITCHCPYSSAIYLGTWL